jgi:hypothetical protein
LFWKPPLQVAFFVSIGLNHTASAITVEATLQPGGMTAPPDQLALKFCLDAATAGALRNEAAVLDRVMRKGTHPGIMQPRHTYLSAETPCLEYESVEGDDLTGLIREWHVSVRDGNVVVLHGGQTSRDGSSNRPSTAIRWGHASKVRKTRWLRSG